MKTIQLATIILAAGKGTRMRSNLPKVLHKLAGKPLLKWVIEAGAALQPVKQLVVYGHGGDQVIQALQEDGVEWVEQTPQLGTGDAVKRALPHLGGCTHVLVLYGDVPLISPATLQDLCAGADETSVHLLTMQLGNPAGYGRIKRDANGHVVAIVEEKDASEAERAINEVNTGIMLLPVMHAKQWLQQLSPANAQGEYYLTDVIGMASAQGIAVLAHNCASHEVQGVNDKLQLAQLERDVQLRQAQQLMRDGVSLADPARIDVRGHLQCGRDVSIDINVVCEGEVVLGDGVTVGAHTVLRNCHIGAGTIVEAFTHIDGGSIGENSRVGPYARIRPGTRTEAEAHIGNFVEIKNSHIDAGSKINHLSYVGDSTVGKRVNIGAGTITCNYDGANKHRTVIGDDAFIGSDSQLVAPVTVGAGATIGAGSTITKDTPAGELTLSRAKQLTITGWKRPVKAAKGEK